MAKPKSKRRRKWIIFTIIVLAIVGLSVAAILRKKEVFITVETEKVQRRNLTELVVANGKVQPVVQVVINPEVSGEIVDLPVKEGQLVKTGDVLVRIKRDNYQASLNSAKANYQSAQAGQNLADANMRKAELEFKRFEELFKDMLVSDSEFLEMKTAFEVAQASHESSVYQVEQAKASMARAQDDLDKTTITAPMDGTVTRLRSQKGERVVGTAMMAGTEIMTIANLNDMEARVDIGEIDIVLVKLGQEAHLEVDAFRDCKFNGTVTEIANAAKGMGGSSQEATKFEVKIRIAEKEEFRPGMSVTAEVETRHRTNVLAVPIQCVTTRLPKKKEKSKKDENTNASTNKSDDLNTVTNSNTVSTNVTSTEETEVETASSTNETEEAESKDPPKPIEVVFVVEDDQVKMAPVKRGISDDDYVEITEGLEEGQEIVSGGYKAINRELEDGKKIKKGKVDKKDKEKKKK